MIPLPLSIRALVIVCLAFLAPDAGRATAPGTVSVVAASDLAFCLQDLTHEFTNAHPAVGVTIRTGSSGNLFAQIQNGAPFDVFLSADMSYPRELIKAGAAEAETLFQYATGRIVLWTMRTNLSLAGGLQALRDPSVKHIAIANPAHAPYGRAARAALQHAGLWESVQPRLVLGESISQTMQFAHTGNADAAIVALSLVLSPQTGRRGRYVEVPAGTYPALEQGAVLTRHGRDNAAALDYLKFLQSTGARTIFERHGFQPPGR